VSSIHIIAARSLNNVIGRGSDIPWKVKGEQKLFKEITMGGTLIMGRVTFESIGRPLKGRSTIIVTRKKEFQHDGCQVAHSIDEALLLAKQIGKTIFVVGGGELYRQCLPLADRVHLTTINTEVEGDIYFPDFPSKNFELIQEKTYKSNIDYCYQIYRRSNGVPCLSEP